MSHLESGLLGVADGDGLVYAQLHRQLVALPLSNASWSSVSLDHGSAEGSPWLYLLNFLRENMSNNEKQHAIDNFNLPGEF